MTTGIILAVLRALGPDAIEADARAAWDAAQDWYINTPMAGIERWYLDASEGRDDMPPIRDESGELVAEWEGIVILHRAITIAQDTAHA